MFQAAPEAIVVLDADGRAVDWNAAAETLFGWSSSEVQGRELRELLGSDDWPEALSPGTRAVSEGGDRSTAPRYVERLVRHRTGQEFAVEVASVPIEVEGEPHRALFVRRPHVVGRHRESQQPLEDFVIQEATSASEEEHDLVDLLERCARTICASTELSAGCVLVAEGDGFRGTAASFGCKGNGDDLRALRDWLADLRVEESRGFLAAIASRAEPVTIEDVRDDAVLGEYGHWPGRYGGFAVPVRIENVVEAVWVFLVEGDRRPRRETLLVTRGVAARAGHLVEQRRWESERARLAAIVDGSYDAIIGRSLDGTITSWNEGATRTYGYSPEEIVGRPASVILPQGASEEEPELAAAIRQGRKLSQFQTRRRRRNGEELEVSITVSPMRDARGRVTGSSTIERDVTSRTRREEELRRAKESAEAASRTKSEFLANISHELRTPMNAIIGMLELALGEPLDEVMRDYLDTAHDSARTLLWLLNDLLDFSRMEAGRFVLDDEPFGFRDTLDGVAKTLSLRAYEKGLELACRVDRNVPDRLQGDGRRLRQILMNLVGNAIKFTEQGEVVVHARAESREGDELVLTTSVRDTGIGILPEHRRRIFNAFSQADASTTREHTGSGLGLAIVRELVHKMQGEITVESEPGQGSTFTFTVRLKVLADQPPPRERVESTRELRDMPVLIVDDNETNRTILAEMLASWHMRPVLADNARAAIERLRAAKESREAFPLVVVDALMPEIDGFDLLKRIEDERLAGRATVLMLSSADRQTFQENLDQLDVAAYLEKPVSQSAMLDAIMTAFEGPPLEQRAVQEIAPARRALRVLLAEDTPANRKVVRSILAKRGHEVDFANNGREALERFYDHDYDVILMDVQMPTMDGLQATRAIRQSGDPERAAIPVVAMTAHAMQGDRERCLAAGMDAYIAKPLDARHLVRLVEELSASAKAGAGRAKPGALESQAPESQPASTSQEGSAVSRDQPPFDAEIALRRLGGDESLLQELVGFFQQDSRELLETIRRSIDKRDGDGLARAGHSLKGLAASLEATGVREAAGTLERHGRDERFDEARSVLEELEWELRRLDEAFERKSS